nr:hypothetical protein [Lachnospiraceae bacterium]
MLNGIYRVADAMLAFVRRVEDIPGKLPELGVVISYAVLHFVMTAFHEPWLDEAVAWQIARCATVSDILFKIPHYEGHPQLWHFIMLPFVRLGMPYEMSLALISFLFTGIAVALIVYKSPFPRVVRCLLPFTYFIFYQYGVIVRPYCVMLLAFVLLAITYKRRSDCPGRYALSLALLAGTSAFGIVMAGGIALVWVIEIWEERRIGVFLKSFLRDRRIWCLFALLMWALFLVASIMPAEDTFATNLKIEQEEYTPMWIRLCYMFFVSLPDVLLTDAYGSYELLQTVEFSPVDLVSAGLLGILLWAVIFLFGRIKKTTFLFLLPHVLLGITGSVLYINIHHIGIVQFLFLFWVWISLEETDKKEQKRIRISKESIVRVMALGSSLCLGVLLFWNISACVQEVQKEYAPGRSLAGFLKKNSLDSYKIMGQWQCIYDEDQGVLLDENTNNCTIAMDIAPYFEKNIVYNYADGKNEGNYISHIVPTEEDNKKNHEKWKAQGIPDILLREPKLGEVWTDGEVAFKDYIPVYVCEVQQIWKVSAENSHIYVYVKRDLARKLGLKAVIGSN